MVSVFDAALSHKANAVLDACKARGVRLATVESCTGGLLCAVLTEQAGSSAVFTHGFVTYSNEAKNEMVGVELKVLGQHGAVSEAVARAMAESALRRSRTELALSITGIAGPGGGTEKKPVGTVHFACAMPGKPTVHHHKIFAGSRSEIRLAAVNHALDMISEELKH